MSAARLCTILAELDFEGHESLNPDSFEWPFQIEETRPLLTWICSSLRPANVLSPAEVLQYEQFVEERKLLEGEDLEFAYGSISAFSSQRGDQDAIFGFEEGISDIRESTLSYTDEAAKLEKQLKWLQCQIDLISHQISFLALGRRARTAATSAASGHLSFLVDDQLSERNLEMNAVLGKIASTAQELARYLSGDGDSIYLAYSDFHSYLAEDSACLKELRQWFTKQFEMGPFQRVAEEGKSKCSWVSLDDSASCVPAKSSPSHSHVSKLQRLRSVSGISERKWIEAQAENAREQAILLTARSQLASHQAHIHLDLHSLRRQHSELSVELSNLYQKEEKLLNEIIPALCVNLAQLQDTFILQGDYNLKVMRQDCYIVEQKVFINHLVNHLSRHLFMKLACEMERKTMLEAYSLLKIIETELQTYISAADSRVSRCICLTQAASEVNEHGAVDDRDTFMHSIRDLLSIHSNVQRDLATYVSAPGIVQQISSLHSDLLSLQFDLESSIPKDRYIYINKLCMLIQNLQRLLFSSSATAQPVLTPWALTVELGEMEKIGLQLSTAIEEVARAHREKAEIFKHHKHEVCRERQVFVDFFCNPDRLKGQVRELSARAKVTQL